MLMVQDRLKWDSVFCRRMIGGAFIIGLVLIGLAFSVII
jgi:hypothetical protein